MADHAQIQIESIEDLRSWLEENYALSESFWLVRWKKGKSESYIEYSEIIDQLLCFGWVDSLPRKLDEERSMLRISPRKPKSNWSGVNKKKVERLTEAGLMHKSGLDLIEIAKQNGAWNFLDDVEKLIVPDDLLETFKRHSKSEYYWNRFPPSSKKSILEWIKNAKTRPTRLKRLEETAEKASRNVKANHPKGRDAGPKPK